MFVRIELTETAPVVNAVLKDFVTMHESYLNTNSAHTYSELSKEFLMHCTVEHAKELNGPNGENNNQAEELNARFDRAKKSIHLNIEPKYLLDYAVETSFRSDTRRSPNGEQLKLAMCVALNVGGSEFWKTFTHKWHRQIELVYPHPQAASASCP